jgi:hypothetical protein
MHVHDLDYIHEEPVFPEEDVWIDPELTWINNRYDDQKEAVWSLYESLYDTKDGASPQRVYETMAWLLLNNGLEDELDELQGRGPVEVTIKNTTPGVQNG